MSSRPWPFVARKTPRKARVPGRWSPFFSPDGQWVGFWQGGQLKKVSITGGAPVALCDAQNPWGASWTADNTILYGQGRDGIWRVPGDGGKPEQVVKVDPNSSPTVRSCCPAGTPSSSRSPATVIGRRRRSSPSRSGPAGVTYPGRRHRRAVCADRSSRVRAWEHPPGAPFDVGRLAVTGGPVPLVEGVGRAPGGLTGAAHFAVSGDGALVYVLTDAFGEQLRTLVWVDRREREEPLKAPPNRISTRDCHRTGLAWRLIETMSKTTFGFSIWPAGHSCPGRMGQPWSSHRFGHRMDRPCCSVRARSASGDHATSSSRRRTGPEPPNS